MATCPTPMGIANGQITSSGTYIVNSFVTYACNSGYSMSGSPSQKCGAGPAWEGSVPVCSYNKDISQTVNQTSPVIQQDNSVLMWILIALAAIIGLVFIGLLILACLHYCTRSGSRSREVTRVHPVDDGEVRVIIPPKKKGKTRTFGTNTDSGYLGGSGGSSVDKWVTVQSNGGNDQTVIHVDQEYERVAPIERAQKKAKLINVWMPHRQNVREINTSTK